MRDHGGKITFAPRLPADWTRLCFRLQIRGNPILVDIRQAETTYTLRAGDGVEIWHEAQSIALSPDRSGVTVANQHPATAPLTD